MSYTIGNDDTGGFETQYVRFGEGERTLVILPGLSVQSVIPAAPAIEKQYEIFRRDFTVYLLERRADPPEVYSICDMADDAAEAMNALGLSGVCMFGASMGGMIAQAIAVRHPKLVEKVALGSSACRVDKERAAVVGEWIRLAKAGDAAELYLSFCEKVYSPELFARYREAFVKMAKSVTKKELERFAILAEGIVGFDIAEQLAKVKIPVLAIGDDTDAVLGADAATEIAEAMKDDPYFEMYMYSGFGHAVYDAAPDHPKRLYDFFMK